MTHSRRFESINRELWLRRISRNNIKTEHPHPKCAYNSITGTVTYANTVYIRSSWRNAVYLSGFYRERSLPLRVPGESAPTIPVAAVTKLRETSFSLSSPRCAYGSKLLSRILAFAFPPEFIRANKTKRSSSQPRISNNGTRPNFPPSLRRVPSPLFHLISFLFKSETSNLLLSPFVVVITRESRLISRNK